MKYRYYISVVLLLFGSGVASADTPIEFERGMNALLEGDFAEAYCQWKPLAHKGYAEAQYNLGWLHANGNGVTVDMRKAFYWWTAAATQGHADAQFALGLSYMAGEGVKRNLETASRWLFLAAQRGHLDARDSLLRLAGDLNFDVLGFLPQLAGESWFGWVGEVTGERVNVRSGPGTNSPIVAKLSKGQKIRVLGRRDNWLRISLPNAEEAPGKPNSLAWIYHSLLKPVGSRSAML